MAKDRDHENEPKQITPKGAEIPVPTRDAVLRDLMKAATKADPPVKPKRRG